MKVFVSYDIHRICRALLSQELETRGIKYELKNSGELILTDRESKKKLDGLKSDLADKGINILENDKMILVEKIKSLIVQSVAKNTMDENTLSKKLSESLNHTYSYLAKIFSEMTHSTIENFTILTKIEEVKRLMVQERLSLTEISYKLGYSSVAHLSRQFKNKIGLTPTQFKNIMDKRGKEL